MISNAQESFGSRADAVVDLTPFHSVAGRPGQVTVVLEYLGVLVIALVAAGTPAEADFEGIGSHILKRREPLQKPLDELPGQFRMTCLV